MINQALSVRSDHSIGESIMQVKNIVENAKKFGFETIALTDTMSVSGLVDFSNKCKKEGIKSIIGCTVRVVKDPLYRKPPKSSGEKEKKNEAYNLKVYAKSSLGVHSLMNLISKGNTEEYFYYHSRVGIQEVLDLEDVIITTGDIFNLFHCSDAEDLLRMIAEKHEVYIELCPVNTPLFDTLNEKAIRASKSLNIPVVAGYPFFYASEDDADTLDVLRAITSNMKMDSRTLNIPYTRDWCFDEPKKLVERMMKLSSRVPDIDRDVIKATFANSAHIATVCNYSFEKLPPSLPKMADDEFAELVRLCKEGWSKRLGSEVMGFKPTNEQLPVYKERLSYELSVLKKLGFSNYFLVVHDIVHWSKQNDVVVGPGRGSVGGSLVAYLIGITDVDPIRFDLLFERFINPDRIDLPDADLDFMSSRRSEVVEYIIGKYGKENVAGISNYSTLGPASALRDVGRVFNLDPLEYACSKQVEKEHGVTLSLEESATSVPDIAKFKAGRPIMWKHATKLEGCMRNLGQHAAGVIVAGEPIKNRAVVLNKKDAILPIVSWDKQVVEDWGLIKMDILGLTTLDIIALAKTYIKERHGKRIDMMKIPLDEPDVMKAFGRGETAAVFQFEGAGMRKLLKDLALEKPLTFEDITAATALYRPGPIDAGLVDQFVAVKQGRRIPEYDHPLMEPALKSTYGVLTYQEQIMQVCRDLAGFRMADADGVRKAMGKKDKDKMATYKEQFIAGAVKSGMGEYAADHLWEQIAGFAGYCFNRSHAAEYSVISYWMMWLKVRYPAEFFAAAMTVIDDEGKLASLVTDAKRVGLSVFPPDINKSSSRIEIVGESELYAPFQAVKGISGNVASHIESVKEAHGRPFASRADFDEAVSAAKLGAKINKSHKEKLDRVGAFASIEAGQLAPLHPDRLRDRIELMPGFTVDSVKPDRGLNDERLAKLAILELSSKFDKCEGCSLKKGNHATPVFGKKPKFMMVFDSPSYKEAQDGQMMVGDNAAIVKAALKEVGLSANDGYFTSLVKAEKRKGDKGLTTEQIMGCSDFLKKEIEILKPPVIITMGSNALRYFSPGIKGAPADLAGKVIYDPKLDASIVFGINPGMIHFDGSKVKLLQESMRILSELLS